MIAADTSAWIDFSRGIETAASNLLEGALVNGNLVLPCPVLFEILSGPGLTSEASELLLQLPKLEVVPGFWERAGDMRRRLLVKKTKARAMDCIVAQNCIDHDVPLIASDNDFRHFKLFGLKLAL